MPLQSRRPCMGMLTYPKLPLHLLSIFHAALRQSIFFRNLRATMNEPSCPAIRTTGTGTYSKPRCLETTELEVYRYIHVIRASGTHRSSPSIYVRASLYISTYSCQRSSSHCRCQPSAPGTTITFFVESAYTLFGPTGYKVDCTGDSVFTGSEVLSAQLPIETSKNFCVRLCRWLRA
jgi:hypothetical protein